MCAWRLTVERDDVGWRQELLWSGSLWKEFEVKRKLRGPR